MKKKILVMGLPGSGKTTLSKEIGKLLENVVIWNADEVRNNINSHLTFSLEDRIKQAKTMRWLSDKVIDAGFLCIVDFICPTPETREAFDYKSSFVIWVDRIKSGRFEDTNKLFVPPDYYDVRVINDGRSAQEWAEEIVSNMIDW